MPSRPAAGFTAIIAIAAAIASAAAPASVQAARPMVTDDARLVDAKACQLETWLRDERGRTEFWALPACNVTGNLELTVGGAIAGPRLDSSETRLSARVLQAKTLLRPMATNGWGIGLAGGVVRDPQAGSHREGGYAYVPISRSLRDDAVFLHANVGWTREPESRRERATWGLSTEVQLGERTWLIAEVFDQSAGRPQHQIGMRYWLLKDRVQIDATYGDRFDGDRTDRWFSVGLRLLSVPFLP